MIPSHFSIFRNLAQRGKSIICTIHQPSSQVFELFDRLMLMAEGRLAYLGPTAGAGEFFDSAGYPSPANYNPADHYLKVLAIAPGNEENCKQRVNDICDNFQKSPQGMWL
jgi:ABC-type multidrug transport system ATPase subunit